MADPENDRAELQRLDVLANGLLKALTEQAIFTEDMDGTTALAVIREHLQAATALHQRVFDLLRHQRSELLAADLITLHEYGWLSAEAAYWESGDPDVPGQGSLSVQRLETYDDHENRMKVMRTRVARVIVTCPVCGPTPDKPPCKTCQDLRSIVKDAIGPDWMEDPALAKLKESADQCDRDAVAAGEHAGSKAMDAVAMRMTARAEAFRKAIDILEGRSA